MKLNILLRDSIIHTLINLGIIGLLMHNDFELSTGMFTFYLSLNLFLMCVVTGISTKRIGGKSEINGWIVGIISYCLLLIVLAQYVHLSLQANAILFAIWSLISFFGGLTGGVIAKPLKVKSA